MSSVPPKRYPLLAPRPNNSERAGFSLAPSIPMSDTSSLSAPSPTVPTIAITPATPSEAVAQPLSMNEIPHNEFSPVYVHTAKCDKCEKHNESVLQRCTTCAIQLCQPCMETGDGKHHMNDKMDWSNYGAQANSHGKMKVNGGIGSQSLARTSAVKASEPKQNAKKTNGKKTDLKKTEEKKPITKTTTEKDQVPPSTTATVSHLTVPKATNPTQKRKSVQAKVADSDYMNVEAAKSATASQRPPRAPRAATPKSFIDIETDDEGAEPAPTSVLGKRSLGAGHEDNGLAEVMHAPKKGKLTQTSAPIANKGKAVLQNNAAPSVANGASKTKVTHAPKKGKLTQASAPMANKGKAVLELHVDQPVANGESSKTASQKTLQQAISGPVANGESSKSGTQQTRQGQDRLVVVFNLKTKRAFRMSDRDPATAPGSTIGTGASPEIDALHTEITQLVARREAIQQQITGLVGESRVINARLTEIARQIDQVIAREHW